MVSECGALTWVSLCGTPQWLANTLATDEESHVETIYTYTTPLQAEAYPDMISDINTVGGFGEGLPASEQSAIKSDLQTTKAYFDAIKSNLIINDPSFNTNGYGYSILNGICVWLGDACVAGF